MRKSILPFVLASSFLAACGGATTPSETTTGVTPSQVVEPTFDALDVDRVTDFPWNTTPFSGSSHDATAVKALYDELWPPPPPGRTGILHCTMDDGIRYRLSF